jgi:hypothetical protein
MGMSLPIDGALIQMTCIRYIKDLSTLGLRGRSTTENGQIWNFTSALYWTTT